MIPPQITTQAAPQCPADVNVSGPGAAPQGPPPFPLEGLVPVPWPSFAADIADRLFGFWKLPGEPMPFLRVNPSRGFPETDGVYLQPPGFTCSAHDLIRLNTVHGDAAIRILRVSRDQALLHCFGLHSFNLTTLNFTEEEPRTPRIVQELRRENGTRCALFLPESSLDPQQFRETFISQIRDESINIRSLGLYLVPQNSVVIIFRDKKFQRAEDSSPDPLYHHLVVTLSDREFRRFKKYAQPHPRQQP